MFFLKTILKLTSAFLFLLVILGLLATLYIGYKGIDAIVGDLSDDKGDMCWQENVGVKNITLDCLNLDTFNFTNFTHNICGGLCNKTILHSKNSS